jgi:hypothetical protein
VTFHAIITKTETVYLIDGYEVPREVYDAFRPSKMFPAESGLSLDEAQKRLDAIKAETDKRPRADRGPYFALAIDGAHPLRSDALAVHPKQIKQAAARNKRHGINVEYDRHGRPVFTDANQRRKLMKLEGVRQMNSYYGA